MIKIMIMFLKFGKLFKWTLKDHDLHLKVNVLLLASVFETFRKEFVNSFELDPVQYLSLPGYSWDATLRVTDINLKLISDMKKYQFVENR